MPPPYDRLRTRKQVNLYVLLTCYLSHIEDFEIVSGGAVDTTICIEYIYLPVRRSRTRIRARYVQFLLRVLHFVGQGVFPPCGCATRERRSSSRRIRETWRIRHAAHTKAQRGETQPEPVAGGAVAGKKSTVSSWYHCCICPHGCGPNLRRRRCFRRIIGIHTPAVLLRISEGKSCVRKKQRLQRLPQGAPYQ